MVEEIISALGRQNHQAAILTRRHEHDRLEARDTVQLVQRCLVPGFVVAFGVPVLDVIPKRPVARPGLG